MTVTITVKMNNNMRVIIMVARVCLFGHGTIYVAAIDTVPII